MRALFPLDGSEASYAALDRGLALLKAVPGLQVTLLNVMQEGFERPADPEFVRETFDADEHDEVFPTRASSERALARGLEIARKHGVAARAKGEFGRPHDEILKEAAHHDVLVMHALPQGGLLGTMKGGGTEKLARAAPCAVLLVRGP